MHEVGASEIFECKQTENVINYRRSVLDIRMVDHAAWLETRERKLVDELLERHTVLQTNRNRNRKTVHQRAERSTFFVHVHEDLTDSLIIVFTRANKYGLSANLCLLCKSSALVR